MKIEADLSSLLKTRSIRPLSLKRFAVIMVEEYMALKDKYGDAVPVSKLYEAVSKRIPMSREDFDIYLDDLAWVSDKISMGTSRAERHIVVRAHTAEELIWH